jgi:hypothetical protein
MFVAPLQARQERERQERERLARIQAEKKRLAKIKAENERQAQLKEEKKRLAKLREEKDRQAKLKEEKKHSDQKPTEVKKTDTKKPDLKAETKKSTDQKPENKKPQSENKTDDKASTDITWSKPGETSPVNSSASSLYSRPPIGQGSEAKPKVPLGRNARPWNGEKTEEPEPKPEPKPYKPRDLSGFKQEVAEGRAKKEQEKQEQLQHTLKHQQQKDDAANHVLKQEGGHDLFKDLSHSVLNGASSFAGNVQKTGTALFNGASNFWMPSAAAAETPSNQVQPLSAFANFRDGSISNRPFQLTPGLPGEMDRNYRETRTPQQLKALNKQLDTRTPQEKLRDRFNQDATKTAQSILKANRDRLKTEQAKYTKDQNPNSAHWQQLWQMADRRREMSTAQSTLKEQKAALDEERVQTSPPPGLYDRDFRETAQASQKRIQSSAYYKRQVQIQSETKDLQSQIDSLEQDKATLEFAHPAIRAVQGETGKKPQDLQEVLERIPGEFDGVRGNIEQLSGDLKNNPSAVINLDSVVSQQLSQLRKDKSVTPEQVNQLEKSIKDEKEGKKRNELLTGLAGAGLTIGSFFIPVGGQVSMGVKAAHLMRVLGAGLSLYSASSALPDLMMLDKATQAQRGGAAKLTLQSEGEAKFNLYMGYTNLVMAGVDTGAHKLAINVAKSAGSKGLQALSQLDRVAMDRILLTAQSKATGQSPEWILAMRDLRKISGNDQSLYQRLVNAFKNAKDKFPPGGSPQLATEGAGAGGNTGRATEELGKKNQPLKSQGPGGAGTVANPNISAEVAAKWSKTKNWNEVEPFIGQQAGSKLPEGYYYRTNKNGNIEIVRKTKNGDEMVPIQVGEDGTFQITTKVSNRISNSAKMSKNFIKAYGKNGEKLDGYWIHHLIPDEIVRTNPLAKLARSTGFDLDRAENLIGLADKKEWQKIIQGKGQKVGDGYTNAIGHWSHHDNYSKQVTNYLDDRLEILERKFGDINQALKDPQKAKQISREINQAMTDAENKFRSLIEKGKVPQKDGRISWDNEQTEPIA